MTSNRDPLAYISDILESLNLILQYTSDQTEESISESQELMDAILLRFALIGEAVAQLPDEFKSEHQVISWNEISAMRNKIIHEYFGWNWYIIWKTIKVDLPKLKKQLEELMKNQEG